MATCNVETLMQDAATSGFPKLAARNKVDLLLQLLCNKSAGGAVVTPNRSYATYVGSLQTNSITGVYTGQGVQFTPATTGQMKIYVAGGMQPVYFSNKVIVSLAYGTGTIPVQNTAAPDGSHLAYLSSEQESDIAVSYSNAFAMYAEINGLTPGTLYYASIIYRSNTAFNVRIRQSSYYAEEQDPQSP